MKTMEADLIIVGGGAAGLAAAITAGEQGATTLVFEKMSTPGGCAAMAAGPFGVESNMQKDHIVSLTKEEAVQKFMNYTHWLSDERLVRKFIYKSGDTINWLEDMGVRFIAPMHYFPGSEETWHFIATRDGKVARRTGAVMIDCMVERAKELGAEIYMNHPVKKLIKEEGEVIGVIVDGPDGEIEAYAGAVIVCTGGFGDNSDMMLEATGLEWGKDLFSIRVPGLTGDGIQMAWDAGADKDRMSMELIYFAPNTMGYELFEIPFRQCDLLVNTDGKRFMNEETEKNPIFTVNALQKQPGCIAWGIVNDSIIDNYIENGPNFKMINSIGLDMSVVRDEINQWMEERPDVLVKADTIEELAEKTGIAKDALKETIEKYNICCESGYDEDYNKERRYLHKIEGPYYACKFAPSGYGSLGGIKINDKFEVIEKGTSKSIPGFYAAGTDANSLYNPDYVFVLPGNTLGFALNSGRLAAESAIDYIKSLAEEE